MPTILVGETTLASPVSKDKAGRSVPIEGKCEWVVGDPTVASITKPTMSGDVTIKGLRDGTTTISVRDPTGRVKNEVLTVKGIPDTLEIYWGGGVEFPENGQSTPTHP